MCTEKNKVDEALSEWKSLGGGYTITVDYSGKNFTFYGGGHNIWDMKGKGIIKVETIQEKTVNDASGDENPGKYVITDIEFNK
jgi:hypothetical protein